MGELKNLEMDIDSEDDNKENDLKDLNLEEFESDKDKKKLDSLSNKLLPSQRQSRANAIRTAKRVQLSFTGVPKPIKKMFDDRAKKLNITKIQLLYECLKANGFEIPDNLDKRKSI